MQNSSSVYILTSYYEITFLACVTGEYAKGISILEQDACSSKRVTGYLIPVHNSKTTNQTNTQPKELLLVIVEFEHSFGIESQLNTK